MTKTEMKHCENLMYEAIRKANNSREDYMAYEKLLKERKTVDAECKLRIADNENGYAEGIHQALVCIGFKHDRMKELEELL